VPALAFGNGESLYRRLAPHCFRANGTANSTAFMVNNWPEEEISVYWAQMISPDKVFVGKPRFGVGELFASEFRVEGFIIRHAPEVAGDLNDPHFQAEGENSKELCRRLADKVRVIRRP
jgi:hypothetical protein